MKADIIIENGRLLTMNAEQPRADAIAIAGDRIITVGDRSSVREFHGPNTRVVDAAGGSVLPGFIESHMHLFGGSAELDQLNLEGIATLDDLAKAVRGYAAERPKDAVIFAGHAPYFVAGEGVATTRHHLDRVMPDRPFAMMAADHHTMWANTAALKLADLMHGADLPAGHLVVLGKDGLATGELLEAAAFAPILARTANGGRDALGYTSGLNPEAPSALEVASDIATIKRGLKYCASFGITSIHNMDGNFYQLELLKQIQADGDLTCRVQIPFLMNSTRPLSDLDDADRMRAAYTDDWVYSGRVKIFLDGVIDSQTAFMTDHFPDGKNGDPLLEAEHYDRIVIEADRRGLQISTHAIGDGGVRRALDGYAAAAKANGPRDRRHRIEHAEVVAPSDMPRFWELGVIPAMQPLHCPGVMGMPLQPTLNHVAPEKRAGGWAWRSLRDQGATIVFASDWPVTPIDPLRSVQGAMTRKAWSDDDLPDQRQGLHETLASYTRDGAYAEFKEDRKGKLAPGMLADIAVLSRDLEETPAEEISGVQCRMTIAGGRVTFERG